MERDPREPLPPMEPLPSLTPSGSTSATALGGALATVIMWALGQKGITFPAGMEAAFAVIIATVLGYIPKSGRRH